jgi:hypothetical protein
MSKEKKAFENLQNEVFKFIQFDKEKRKLKKSNIEETFSLLNAMAYMSKIINN